MTGARAPSALLLLGQSPFDPASGAARSMQTLARWLARAGWQVSSLSTNASESPRRAGGLSVEDIVQATGGTGGKPTALGLRAGPDGWHMQWQGVAWRWLTTSRQFAWQAEVGEAYNAELQRLLQQRVPDLVLSFGDDPGDRQRRAACRHAGARVVFALHNRAYLGRALPDVDVLLCPSQHLLDAYAATGLAAPGALQLLPAPVEADDLGPPATHQPLCLVFANPEPAKGALLVARLVAELARQNADIPVLVAGGRGSVTDFATALAAAGVSPQALPSLMLAPDGLTPAALMGLARVVLMPSVVAEAAGRMAIEAMCVGAVPLVSNRGALPETVATGGLVLPLPRPWVDQPGTLPSAQAVAPWTQAVQRLFNEPEHWQRLSAAARQRSAVFCAAQGVPALAQLAQRWLQRPAQAGCAPQPRR